MFALALVRDILRPAPWEELLQDCVLPLPRVMKEPTYRMIALTYISLASIL